MNSIPELQLDALIEVFNIGSCRAAASLSEIVGEEVKLSVPRIRFFKSDEISAEDLSLHSDRLGAVSQNFSGAFNANAMLLFTEERALEIVRDMMGSQLSIEELAEFEQEAMCELGNIILNACMSSIADMLNIKLSSSLPTYKVNSSEAILQEIAATANQPFMLEMHVDLIIERQHSEGNIVFLLSTSSLQELLRQIDHFVSGI